MARYRQSGPIRFGEINNEFFGRGISSYSLDNYYRGGGIVPSTGPTNGIAAVHQIAVDPNASSAGTGVGQEEFYLYLTGNSGNSTEPLPDITRTNALTLARGGDSTELGSITGSFTDVSIDSVTVDFRLDSTVGLAASDVIERLTLVNTAPSADGELNIGDPVDNVGVIEIGITEAQQTELANRYGIAVGQSTTITDYITVTSSINNYVEVLRGTSVALSSNPRTFQFTYDTRSGNPQLSSYNTIGVRPAAGQRVFSIRLDRLTAVDLDIIYSDGTDTETYVMNLESLTRNQSITAPTQAGLFTDLTAPITVSIQNGSLTGTSLTCLLYTSPSPRDS